MDASTPFSVLPLIGYAVLAVAFAYISITVYKRLKYTYGSSGNLPKPVSGSSHKISFASIARSSAWDWRRWTPRIPWSRLKPSDETTKIPKSLSVELLPTTGLPPPPSALPPAPQLVDLSTPPLTADSAANLSFPPSPRTPSPSFLHQQHHQQYSFSKPLYPTPVHPSYPRPLSPHALLATTSPLKHQRRSRSLGGVPVCRLSTGGTSSLRNAVEMKELNAPSHGYEQLADLREHLLIDFSSSGSSDEEDKWEIQKSDISPAASDIGVLPPSTRDVPPIVGRLVPLVDLGGDKEQSPVDEEAWKWFNARPGSSSRQASPSTSMSRTTTLTLIDARAKETPVMEKLVDVDGDDCEIIADVAPVVVGLDDVDESKLLKDGPLDQVRLDVKKPQSTTVPVKAAFSHPLEDLVQAIEPQPRPSPPLPPQNLGPSSVTSEPELDVRASQESLKEEPELVRVESVSPNPSPSTSPEPSSPISLPDFVQSQILSSPLSWTEEVGMHDPWNTPDESILRYPNHYNDTPDLPKLPPDLMSFGSEFSESDSESNVDVQSVVFAPPSEGSIADILDKSPGGSLFATVLPDDDDPMPALELAGGQINDEIFESLVDIEEEEVTPKPTPASAKLELPDLVAPLPPPPPIPEGPAAQASPILALAPEEKSLLAEEPELIWDFPDPDFLPLPDLPLPPPPPPLDSSALPQTSLLLSFDQPTDENENEDSKDKDKDKVDDELQLKSIIPSQTPTPPASPPLVVSPPIRFGDATTVSSFAALSLADETSVLHRRSSSASPRERLSLDLPLLIISSSASSLGKEDKDNMTPTAVTCKMDDEIPPSPALPLPLSTIDSSEESKEEDSSAMEIGSEERSSIQVHPKDEAELSSPLPGSFPESIIASSSPPSSSSSSSHPPSTTIGARLALTPNTFSLRSMIQSPIDVALAMQLRPGLGAGADPAWMVRFLMAMFGWLAVVVSGGGEY